MYVRTQQWAASEPASGPCPSLHQLPIWTWELHELAPPGSHPLLDTRIVQLIGSYRLWVHLKGAIRLVLKTVLSQQGSEVACSYKISILR